MSDSPLPPVDELPILPNMAEYKLDLAVSDQGAIYIFHEKAFEEPLNWIEYDEDIGMLYCITKLGRIKGLGIKIQEVMQNSMVGINSIFVVHMKSENDQTVIEVPLLRTT